ncbi:hypothetical protein GYMLUDRAFT_253185 [Collybiopsis luxurians FD-317 M1]|uniref:Uncharacterized protein n=1 Tax=Collybiopsis luxurians FD-317 M1 TaxID=944289 RepID=A0A0D0C654_9AGAR|nr:hypothetical protein GYMLUDRAFT_253185 [Collybiopsis luxurians FD-317 M1]
MVSKERFHYRSVGSLTGGVAGDAPSSLPFTTVIVVVTTIILFLKAIIPIVIPVIVFLLHCSLLLPLLLVPPTNKRLCPTTLSPPNISTTYIFNHPRQRQLSHLAGHAVPKLVGFEAENDKADTTTETDKPMVPRPYASQG